MERHRHRRKEIYHDQAILSVQSDWRTDGRPELTRPWLRLPWTIAEPRLLGDIFGNLVDGLLDITCGAKESDLVEIIDG